jgi:hypothetical protein
MGKWKMTHFKLREKGWKLHGNYHTFTDEEGETLLKIRTNIKAPVHLNMENGPHYQNWYFPYASYTQIENYICGADKIDLEDRPKPYQPFTGTSQIDQSWETFWQQPAKS